jgi:uncharacterized protein (TIGR02145 family)/uncharacterized repeat protein (TIGR02543 family)
MFKKATWFVIASSVLIPLLLSCTGSTSPYTAANATISIILENSTKQRSTDAVTDTVDKTVHVGISAYLPKYITSVFLSTTKSPGDTDTTFTFTKISDWPDTHWVSITFHSAGTRTVSAIASIPEAKDYSLTAKFIIAGKLSPVIYNGNGNTGGTVPVDANFYQQGATVTVKANTGALVRTGYTFAGWNTAADGSGASYAGGETFTMGASNAMLYAKWTKNPTYSITYNGNGNTGGTVPIDANAYEQGANVTVRANTGNLTKASFTFAGWNTAADGSGTSYAGVATLTMGTANIILYAKWTQNPTYTMTYNGNGNTTGTVPSDANFYELNAAVTIMPNTGNLTKSGYTFAGWNTAADGSGTLYAAGATLTMGTANVTLYARWTQNPTYTVTYSGNGNATGTVPTDTNAYEQNTTVTVKANAGNLAKTGFTFAGWNTAADGSGTSYAAGATFTMGTANVTLYAKWTVAVLTVKFNSNGGSAVDSQNVTYNATATSPAATTRSGYIFAGWYSDQALTVQFAFTTPITSAMTLYAKWTQVYAVTYNGNGNTAGIAPVDANTYLNGVTVTVLDNTGSLIKTGYTFSGWNTNAAGTGIDRLAGSTFTMGSTNVTLYAKWTINQYAVTFNSNGGSAVTSQKVNYNATATAPNWPTKTSYIFAQWFTDQTFTTQFSFSTPITGDITLYAKWEIRDADGNLYTETIINGKHWMAQNLRTTRYNNGSLIPQVTDNSTWAATSGAYCWFNNDSTNKIAYGALYNWATVSTNVLAPQGWHVAADSEWMQMFNYLGGIGSQASTDAVREQGIAHWLAPNTGATNSSGFTAVSTGLRLASGAFWSDNPMAAWWSSTPDGTGAAWFYDVGETFSEQFYDPWNVGLTIRCVRDY